MMTIQKRIFQITLFVLIFVLCSFFGLMQVAKGARFHHLNLLHQKHVAELRADHLEAINANKVDIVDLRKTLTSILELPVACLNLVNVLDRTIMSIIGTGLAIQLCEEEVVTSTKMLVVLDQYENSEITFAELKSSFVETLNIYDENSVLFEKPIEKTVDFIVAVSFISFLVLSVLLTIAFILIIRSISNAVLQMEKNTRALAKSEALNRKLAHFDTLTGLPNRNYFLEKLKDEVQLASKTNSEVAMLFIDLDHFKDVNDSMGHNAGDELIHLAGERIAACISNNDIVARIGGDEFNLLIHGSDCHKTAKLVAEKILASISVVFAIKARDTYITASIGVAVYPHDADNVDDLQKYADLAMYHAKSKGKNTVEFYSSDIEIGVTARIQMAKDLRLALDRNEFMLHFQPVIRLTDLRITGAEALIRWHHPELGMVSPVDFIPRAEETGDIVALGEWVLQTACIQCKQWYDQTGGNFTVAVNVSPVQLSSGTFVASVHEALELSGLPASALDIEITENLVINEADQSVATLFELSKLGVRLLLDDFGTGHSSLSYLHKLPFDVLKIDRSFIQKLEQRDTKNITSSIIAMAHELDLEVIAEGVETADSLTMLQDMNCAFAQGYLFSPPVPAKEIDCDKIYLSDPSQRNDRNVA